MFKPVSLQGIFFKNYLRLPAYPSKIRMQNIAGKRFFSKGISMKDENTVWFTLDVNDWITRIMLLEGAYENASTSLAKKILSNGGLFIDIGANFGLFTCIAAFNNDKVKVIAVEPNHKVLHRLIHNIKQNDLEKNVQVINAAVSDKFQLVTMDQPASNNLGTTVTRAGNDGYLSVLSCSLDFICMENKVSVIELLKIDIEGNEFQILKDFSFDRYHVKNIILEFNHLSKISFDELRSFFAGKGFKSYTITGQELDSDVSGIPENNIWFVNREIEAQF